MPDNDDSEKIINEIDKIVSMFPEKYRKKVIKMMIKKLREMLKEV